MFGRRKAARPYVKLWFVLTQPHTCEELVTFISGLHMRFFLGPSVRPPSPGVAGSEGAGRGLGEEEMAGGEVGGWCHFSPALHHTRPLPFLSPKKNSFLKFPKEQTRASPSSLALEWKDSSYKLG